MQEKVYASDNDHHSQGQPFLWIWRLIAVDAERDACDKKEQLELQCPAQANSQGALRAHKMQGLRHVPCSWTHHFRDLQSTGAMSVHPSIKFQRVPGPSLCSRDRQSNEVSWCCLCRGVNSGFVTPLTLALVPIIR